TGTPSRSTTMGIWTLSSGALSRVARSRRTKSMRPSRWMTTSGRSIRMCMGVWASIRLLSGSRH
ncbi:hypothetical protein KXV85_008895, partial [Aspergillus fumigatus]